MNIFMSGTPRNDAYQSKEDTLNTHRLFSLHGSYLRAVMSWVNNVPDDRDARPYPKIIMLDSGAFTAWNKGHVTSVAEVLAAYTQFLEIARDKFDKIVMINLDVIPGEKGRDPTVEELTDAVKVSDENFKILTDRFGDVVLPVYHQGEHEDRLHEVSEQASYICISPRNDLQENVRVIWSAATHAALKPGVTTHGLATTGNKMMRDVPWTTVDSAAWVLHGAYGKLDIFVGDKYLNVFLSNDAGKQRYFDDHYETFSEPIRVKIRHTIESYGYTLQQVQESGRLRGIVNMGELQKAVDHRRGVGHHKSVQSTLFGV